ncbi:hypothetical protein J2755_000295 [Methanohalophilus levihalophilus]|uniref:hypothetical protein n=1 Tax=Methanohalophilus levihalophilus TaxID=1431282 RepID=UPI001AE38F4F|nr:hypothetical protein [Methanohalophilus levihalophilus]MBP2029375.1 hypothetical protein [Methanohalophilus levihalophilus]
MANNTTFQFDWNTTYNDSAFNLSNYPSIMNFTDLTSPDAFMVPVTDVWIVAFGDWFYVILMMICVGYVLIKSRSIFPTSLTLLLLSAIGAYSIPTEVVYVMYLMLVLSLFGALYGFFEDRRQ